eukprot:TRINITY_DN7224_c0_g1_i1.p1 TRINITY_DN7224_c0_g1~~TRINITY_DN7224_c0_g1_i1.p1  ORF type:complete len:164 (+),score=36.08 TRINITY_DN7224_c0_g1_i1:99-590(+)
MAHSAAVLSNKAIRSACEDASTLLRKHYYPAWDEPPQRRVDTRVDPATGQPARHAKLWFLYHPEAQILWNGHMAGRDGVDELVAAMPHCAHTLTCLDVVPLQDDAHFLASVHGHCKYDGAVCRTFHQQFVVWRTANPAGEVLHWIVQDQMRWLSEEDVSYTER